MHHWDIQCIAGCEGKPDVSRVLPILQWLLSCFTCKTMEEEGAPVKRLLFLKTFFLCISKKLWLSHDYLHCTVSCKLRVIQWYHKGGRKRMERDGYRKRGWCRTYSDGLNCIQTDLSEECCISVALTAVFQHKEQEISCQNRKTIQNKLIHVLDIYYWSAPPTL